MTLQNGVQRLYVRLGMRLDTAIVPSKGTKGRDAIARFVNRGRRNDVVQLHNDIRTDLVLTLYGIFWSQFCEFARVWGFKDDGFLGDL